MREGHGFESISVLGVPVDLATAGAVASWIATAVADPWDGFCRHLVTVNPEYVVQAGRDDAFAASLVGADLRVADGIGIVYAAWLLTGRRADQLERVTGVDIVERLVAIGLQGARPFLLGGAHGVGEQAAQHLKERYPGAQVAGWWGGGTPNPGDDDESLARIADAKATVLCVAYGAPDQVVWIERNRTALATAGVRLAVGVGGALDYIAGAVPRAPEWVRRVGLEWLYRLIREPWRWRRQLALPWFAVLVLAQRGRLIRPARRDG